MVEHDEIIAALRRITRAIDLQSKRLVKTTGLTVPQLVVLQTLQRNPDASSSAIAKLVSLSQATVTTILDRLERNGFVTRERSSLDKRVVHARLTETGLKAAEGPAGLLQTGFIREFHKLEAWERHMLVAALQRIAVLMEAQDLDDLARLGADELSED